MESESIASGRRRRIGPGTIVLIGAGGLLLLVLLFTARFKITGRRALNAELAKIRAAGEPASAGELESYYQSPPSDRDTTQLWLQATEPLGTPQFQSDAKALPIVGMGLETVPWPGEPWPELAEAEQLLAQYQRSLELMHQAAREGGLARYPTRFADGGMTLLPHVQQLRTGVRLLALEAAVEGHHGRPDAAVDAIVTIFAAGRSLEQEPCIVSQLVRIAIDGTARERVRWLSSALALDDAQLARLDAELAACEYRRSTYIALLGERVIGIEAFANPAKLGDEGEAFAFLGAFNGDRDQIMYLQLMGELIAAADKSREAGELAAAKVDVQLQQLAGSRGSRLSHPLTLMLMPALSAFMEAASRNEASRDATRAAVAVERFRLANDRLPQTLDELTPTFLDAVPIDPFDGARLRYRIDAMEYVVYSVGKDKVDQNGQSEPPSQGDDVAARVRIQKAPAEPSAPQQ
ncbi:MAG TPA: hypothetical protein VMV10_22105 [Pirellulales bacterium]|nr:hypothetical protein [Pirellulales bacterium]